MVVDMDWDRKVVACVKGMHQVSCLLGACVPR